MSVAVFFVSRKRPGFDPQWGAFIERSVRKQLPDAFFYGPLADDEAVKHSINDAKRNGADVFIISQPTMGDGNLATVFAAEWDAPLIVWATPENPDNPKVSACGLTGAHNWASYLAQIGKPPLVVYGLPNTAEVVNDLNAAIRQARAIRKLKHGKVALIGGHAPGFLNMAVDAAALQQLLGTRLKQIGLHEFINVVRSLPGELVAEDVRKTKALNIPIRSGVELSDNVFDISSRYYLALKQLIREESLDAVALRCWGELPNELGVWAYLAVARLSDEGVNICEEGDIDGALGVLLAAELVPQAAAFNTDWLEHDDETITLWHAGATPFLLTEKHELDVHFNTNKPVVVDSKLLSGIPVTLFRFWRFNNEYRLAIIEGTTEAVPRHIDGFSGTVRVQNGGIKEFFLDALTAGMPHHITVVKGHIAKQLKRLAKHYQPKPVDVVLELNTGGQR
ncbi:MAG: hypothetical protein LBN39_03860 [Planctomycetaceae bacterium]|jgi:L-fucose isomerase-like protein|nr:hypothetical protein [Planctomycetaceae bacterium]